MDFRLKEIVFLLPSLKNGGGNRVVIELSNELVGLGYNVSIVYPNNSADTCSYFIHDAINLMPIGCLANSNFSKLINLFKTLSYTSANFSKDAVPVIFTDPIMSLFSPLVKSPNKYRFIQADDYRIFDDLHVLKRKIFLGLYKVFTKVSYKKFNTKFIFNSKYTYECFTEVSRLRSLPYYLVHPAINNSVFKVTTQRVGLERPVIGIVARKHPLKGFMDFVSAVNSIERSLYSKIIVISHDDLSAFDLTGMTIVKPNSDKEMSILLNSIDVFVSTSWWEGFGLPPLEAMACGCAVIVSDSGGVNEYVKNGKNCLMFEPKNIDQLTCVLTRLLSDNSLMKRLSSEGINTSQKFSWYKSAQQLVEIL